MNRANFTTRTRGALDLAVRGRQLDSAVEIILQATAVMQLVAFAIDHLEALADGKRRDEIVASVGRAAEASQHLSMDAVILVDDIADDLRGQCNDDAHSN